MRIFGCATLTLGAAALAALALHPLATAAPPEAGALIERAQNWRLNDHQGASHELYRYGDRKAVLLYSTSLDSDLAEADLTAIAILRESYDGKTLGTLAIAAQARDNRARLERWKAVAELGVPVLHDEAQLASVSLQFETIAEAVLLDTEDWRAVYRGPVRGEDGELHSVLAKAISALTKGEDPAPTALAAPGAEFEFKKHSDIPTYATEVAPILAAKCVKCHSEGNIAPFVMDSYRRVSGWAPMIKEAVMTRRMPPWHADTHVSHFSNEVTLTPEESRAIIAWADNGTPRGEGDDILREASRKAADEDGWLLGEPDLVVSMQREEKLPAQGVFDYRYQRARVKLDGDKWVKGVELRPGNREVLHHALVFVEYPAKYADQQPEYHGGAGGYFAGYVPGMLPIFYPENSGKFLPDGSTIIFQMHYTATGKEETDRSELGLHFYDEKPEMLFKTRSATNRGIEIAPGDHDSEYAAVYRISQDSTLWGFNPHMHLRGSRFAYTAVLPDGSEKKLLNVPFYDFNWQTEYRLAEPVTLPAGSRIICEGAFDNSAINPANPDPDEWVYWGDQSWEEMFIGFLSYSPIPGGSKKGPKREKIAGPITEEALQGTEWQFMRFRILFERDGLIIVDDALNGKWDFVDDDTIKVEVGDRGIVIDVADNKMSVNGMPLKQLTD